MRVSIIVPTWNERENIERLLDGIGAALQGADYEVLVVDDGSPDGTAEVVAARASWDPRVRLVRRHGKRGLAGAVLDGAQAARGEYLVMMDADLSHDPAAIPSLLSKLDEGYDVAVGSRYVTGGGVVAWPIPRRLGSRLSILFGRLVLGLSVRDPTSGFVGLRRGLLTQLPTRYSARGFKLLVEVLVVWPGLRVAECPITFRDRASGRSKFNAGEMVAYAWLCLRLLPYRLSRARR